MASLYWYRHRHRPYLVDHCFVPNAWLGNVRRLEYGSAEDWLMHSDHVPLTIEIHVPADQDVVETIG